MTIIKRIAYTASLLAALTASLTSCDIASDDRFILEDKVVPQRNVLLMDFTGQGCINCPNAHDVMSELSKQYNTDGKTNLITVSIHAGAQAMSVDRTDFSADRIGLMIAEGQEMNDAFSINAWPTGAVDHINGKDNALLYAEWPAAVRTAFEKPTDINIEATATLTDDRIEVSTNVHSTSDQDIALQVWVIENGIKASQRLPDGSFETEYIHNHVLRFVQYPVKSGKPMQLKAGVIGTDECTIPLKWTDKERWNRDNLQIVVFAFRGSDILNCTIANPVPATQPE